MTQESNPGKSELKQLLRTLNRGWKAVKAEEHPLEPCPDSWTLAQYVTGELDNEARQTGDLKRKAERTINSHIAFCDSCFEEYVALAGPEGLRKLLSRAEWNYEVRELPWAPNNRDELVAQWPTIRDDKKKCVIDLARTYGAHTHLGTVRINAERPMFVAARWKSALNEILARDNSDVDWCDGELSKEFEIAISENVYLVKVGVTSKGGMVKDTKARVSCYISGLRTPLQMPLRVLVWDTRDLTNLHSVQSWQTTKLGEVHVPFAGTIGIVILTLILKDDEQSIEIRIPEDVFGASIRNLFEKIRDVASPEMIIDHLRQVKEGADSLLPLVEGISYPVAETWLGPTKKRSK